MKLQNVSLLLSAVLLIAFGPVAFAQTSKPKLAEEVLVFDPLHLSLFALGAEHDLVIDHLHSQGYEVYGPAGLKERLEKRGLVVQPVTHKKELGYPTYVQFEKTLKDLQSKYPNIMRLTSVGKSVKGRDLWTMKIAKNPDQDAKLPEVKFISSMHGDEITGRELMVNLLDELGRLYGTDEAITRLVDNTEIFIMPSMNPDGSEKVQRWNANGVDLNRSFPDFTTNDDQNVMNGREPEIQAIMGWQASRKFSLSANFHGGAEVVNYAWDTQAPLHPLDSMLVKIALEYASQVPYMASSSEFENGITNGYAWYEVDGGMQDWSTYWYNDVQFTIELSGTKYPAYSQIPKYWKDNRQALVHFLETVHQGAGFKFAEAGIAGNVTISKGGTTIETLAFSNSEFYAVLEPGTYHFAVNKSGESTPREFDIEAKKDVITTGGNYVEL